MELKISHITKRFESYDGKSTVNAVDDVNLNIKDGDLVTLLGPSGCGKTTLLRMIAGFEDPTGGDIFFGEKKVNNLAPNRRNATLVFQSYAIFPHLNVYDNIVFGLKLKNLKASEIKTKMEKVLKLVGLEGFENRAPSQLSGGQQQRVALARAIVMEPELLLFDEPLSNLDAKLREQMRIEIRALQKTLGTTSLYVTHDQAEAMSISDVVVVMNKGHIEQLGSPQELYAKPVNRFVADFIGKANFLESRVNGSKVLWGDFELKVKSNDLPDEGDVDILVRPEAVVISENGDIPGKITRATFLGNLVEYEVSVKDMGKITVHEINPLVGDIYSQGMEVKLSFKPGTLHVLKSN